MNRRDTVAERMTTGRAQGRRTVGRRRHGIKAILFELGIGNTTVERVSLERRVRVSLNYTIEVRPLNNISSMTTLVCKVTPKFTYMKGMLVHNLTAPISLSYP